MILPKKCSISLEQAEAQMLFNEWNERDDIVILDTETTGLYGEICEISVIDRHGNVLFDSLVKPVDPIPGEATFIHGITNEMVEGAPSWPEVWKKLYGVIKDKLILIYNSEFDVRLMEESFDPYEEEIGFGEIEDLKEQVWELQTQCVMKTYAQLVGSQRWLKLTEACGYATEHRALSDCKATLDVIKKCYKPEFTQRDFELVKWWDELESTSRRIRYLNHRIRELTEEQAELLKKQKQLLQRLVTDEASKEVAASVSEDPPTDISDDDLPF